MTVPTLEELGGEAFVRITKHLQTRDSLRPIVSFVNSATYACSKHLVHALPPVGKSSAHRKNSAEFASFIAGQTLNREIVLVSFDVVSLFTKVPNGLATKVAHEHLTMDLLRAKQMALSPDQFVQLLKFVLVPHICPTER